MEKPHRIGKDKRFRTDHWLMKTTLTRLPDYTKPGAHCQEPATPIYI